MSQVGIVRENAILPFEAASDLTGLEGQPVIITQGDKVTICEQMGGAAPIGVLLKGGKAGETVSVAIATAGLAGTVRLKLGGAVANVGTLLELLEGANGCTFTPHTGMAACYTMAQALEIGVADEKIEAVIFRPRFM